MGKTKIPWCDFTVNPVKGLCPMACPYCYARAMYHRFKWNPEIRYIGRESLFNEVLRIPRDKPQKIFVGSTMELFGDWTQPFWIQDIFEVINTFSFFTFIFLTKCPQNLPKEWPDNCWVGVSVTNIEQYYDAAYWLKEIKANIKFLSLEPLLERILPNKAWPWGLHFENINWLIIGCRTPVNKKTMCKESWAKEIIEAADKAGIPVFIKEPMASFYGIYRQEFPKG